MAISDEDEAKLDALLNGIHAEFDLLDAKHRAQAAREQRAPGCGKSTPGGDAAVQKTRMAIQAIQHEDRDPQESAEIPPEEAAELREEAVGARRRQTRFFDVLKMQGIPKRA